MTTFLQLNWKNPKVNVFKPSMVQVRSAGFLVFGRLVFVVEKQFRLIFVCQSEVLTKSLENVKVSLGLTPRGDYCEMTITDRVANKLMYKVLSHG